jgi:hypothetical protein
MHRPSSHAHAVRPTTPIAPKVAVKKPELPARPAARRTRQSSPIAAVWKAEVNDANRELNFTEADDDRSGVFCDETSGSQGRRGDILQIFKAQFHTYLCDQEHYSVNPLVA